MPGYSLICTFLVQLQVKIFVCVCVCFFVFQCCCVISVVLNPTPNGCSALCAICLTCTGRVLLSVNVETTNQHFHSDISTPVLSRRSVGKLVEAI